MTTQSSNQDIELKSLNSKASDYDNQRPPSEYDTNENEETIHLDHLMSSCDDDLETTPFLEKPPEEKNNEIPLKNRSTEDDGNLAENETLLRIQETNVDEIAHEPANEGDVENQNPDSQSHIIDRLIEIVKSNWAIFMCVVALVISTIFVALILPKSIFSIEYDKVNFSQ